MAFNFSTLTKIAKAVLQESGMSMTRFAKMHNLPFGNIQRMLNQDYDYRIYCDNMYILIKELSTISAIQNRTFDFTPFVTEPDGPEMIGYFLGIAYSEDLGKLYTKIQLTDHINALTEILRKVQ